MIILETATNIVVPDMGEEWHRLRNDDFSAVDFTAGRHPRSSELVLFIMGMMHSESSKRVTMAQVHDHPILSRARTAMAQKLAEAMANETSLFTASPLGGEPDSYLADVLGICDIMDSSP